MGVIIFIVIAVVIIWKVVLPWKEEKRYRELVDAAYRGEKAAIFDLSLWFQSPILHNKSKTIVAYAGKSGLLNKIQNDGRAYILRGLYYKLNNMDIDLIRHQFPDCTPETSEMLEELLEIHFTKYSQDRAIEEILDLILDINFGK